LGDVVRGEGFVEGTVGAAALRFVSSPLLNGAGLVGDEMAMRTLDMDTVNGWVSTSAIGVTLGVRCNSGVFVVRSVFKGVANVDGVGVVSGCDFDFVLS